MTYMFFTITISSVVRQKGESQYGGNKKIKHAKFSEKRTFLTPRYANVRARIRTHTRFFGKFDMPSFLVTFILRLAPSS